MEGKTQCCESVSDNWSSYPCGKKANIEIKGKYYCGTHNPLNVKKRDEKTSKRYDDEEKVRMYGYVAKIYCKKKGLTLEEMEKFTKEVKHE